MSLSNEQVCHLWAHQSRTYAKGYSILFNGPVIYSWGHHFPVAMLTQHPDTGAPLVLFNSARYSASTSKHQCYVRRAVSHLEVIYVRQCDVTTKPKSAAHLEQMRADYAAEVASNADAARRARNEQARARRRAQKEREQARAAYPAELEAWRNGGQLPRAHYANGHATALRLIDGGKRIETTQRAVVPSCIARKAWPILQKAVADWEAVPFLTRTYWQPFFELPDFNWGDYRGIALRAVSRGSEPELRIGCHCIPWREVVLIAEALGLPVNVPEVSRV